MRIGVVLAAGLILAGWAGSTPAEAGSRRKNTVRNANRPGSSSPWLRERSYSDQAFGKLGYGLKNTLFGWTELLTEPYEAAQDPNRNVLQGVAEGVWNGVGQTVGGAVDVVTAPVPGAAVPLPEGGTKVF